MEVVERDDGAVLGRQRGDPVAYDRAQLPLLGPFGRLDEATAARQPNLRWRPLTGRQMPCPD